MSTPLNVLRYERFGPSFRSKFGVAMLCGSGGNTVQNVLENML